MPAVSKAHDIVILLILMVLSPGFEREMIADVAVK